MPNLSSLLKKPVIQYTPDAVSLPSPLALEETSTVYQQSSQSVVSDTQDMLRNEISACEDLMSEIVRALPSVEIVVPDSAKDLVGAETITLSDYLENLSGNDYGPTALRDVFEEHVSAVEPAALLCPLLDMVKASLEQDLQMTMDKMFQGDFTEPAGVEANTLVIFRENVANAQAFRTEVSLAAEQCRSAIDKAVWAGLIKGSNLSEFEDNMEGLAQSLERIKSLLKVSTTIMSVDWKSLVNNLRLTLQNVLMDQIMSTMLSAYQQAYSKVVSPTESFLSYLGSSEIPEVQKLKALLEQPMDHIKRKTTKVITDIYILRNQRAEIQVQGARAVGAMCYNWRIIKQLDSVIQGLQTLASGSHTNYESEAPTGALAKILDSPKVISLTNGISSLPEGGYYPV